MVEADGFPDPAGAGGGDLRDMRVKDTQEIARPRAPKTSRLERVDVFGLPLHTAFRAILTMAPYGAGPIREASDSALIRPIPSSLSARS